MGALRLIGALYLLASLLALIVYWYDKRSAREGKMRVPEKTLHTIEALGGWPGALLAQRWLRHKNQKQAYQRVFWAIVLGHFALWGISGYLVYRFT